MLEIERDWSFEDVANAHALLDAFDDAEAEAMERARRDSERRSPRAGR